MKRIYTCPACEAVLNPSTKIILTAAKGKTRGLVLFSPTPGNYSAVISENLHLKSGDKVDFSCPVCQASLVSGVNPNLVEISFHLDNGIDGKVNFSRILGEHATYFTTSESVRSYGDNAERYGNINFFGASSDQE